MTGDNKENKEKTPGKIKIAPKSVPGPSRITPPEGPTSDDLTGLYVDRRKRKFPSWLLALLVAIVLIVSIFWVFPHLLAGDKEELPVPTSGSVSVGATNRIVVTKNSSWLYNEPKRGAERVGEILFNEGLELIDASDERYLLVNTDHGLRGYIARSDVSADASGLDPTQAILKVVVRTPSKNIMSHTKGGTVIARAPLGSVLYADYQDTNVIRVRLPQGVRGWISKQDVFIMNPEENLSQSEDIEAALVSTALTFNKTTWVPRGITTTGIDMAGVIYLSSSINGLRVSRQDSSLASIGTKLDLPLNTETDCCDLRYAKGGDILILDNSMQEEGSIDFALILPDNRVLMRAIGSSTISVYSLNNKSLMLEERIKEARRLSNKKAS